MSAFASYLLLLVLVTLFSTSAAAQIQPPLCSQQCLAPVLAALPCYTPTSSPSALAACFCPNTTAQAQVASCAQSACNDTERDLAGRLGQAWCAAQPTPSRSHELIVAAALLAVFVSVFVSLRAWSRILTRYRLGWDDATLGVATVAIFAFLALEVPNALMGTGKHVWDVDPEAGPGLLKIYFALKLIYIVAQVFTKLSLVLFYLRIFPYRWVRVASWIMFAWLVGHAVIFFFLELFQCWPIEAFWDSTMSGKCRDETAVFYAGAATSIFEDLYILALPIPCISALNMGLRKKTLICFVFALGSFACITSMIRLRVLHTFTTSTDGTWDGLDLGIWSCAEISVAAICGCLPTLRPLLSRYLPRLFGTESHSSNRSDQHASKSFRFRLRHITDDPEAADHPPTRHSKASSGKASSKSTHLSSDSTECIHDVQKLQQQNDASSSLENGNEETELVARPNADWNKGIEIVKTTEVTAGDEVLQDQAREAGGVGQAYGDPHQMQQEPDPYKWELSYVRRPGGQQASS